MLVYRNTPQPDTQVSPAMCIFRRPIRSPMPILPGKYQPHPTWQDTMQKREEALRQRHLKISERLVIGTRPLPPLKVGDHVRIQNQVGRNPRKWDRTGTIIEVKQFDQYGVKVDGSGRVTLHNRKFLRRFIPVMPRIPSFHPPSSFTQIPYPSQNFTIHPSPLPSNSSSVPTSHPSLSSGLDKTAASMAVKRDVQQQTRVGTSTPTWQHDSTRPEVQPLRVVQPTRVAQPAQVVQQTQELQPTQVIQPARIAQPTHVVQPTQVAQPTLQVRRSQ